MSRNSIAKIIITTVALCLLWSEFTYAAQSYPSYCITDSGDVISVPLPYAANEYYVSFGDEKTALASPQDLFIDSSDNIYIADTGNNRILVLDKQYKLVTVIGDGQLNTPKGVCVENGIIYVADSGNSRIVQFKLDGTLIKEIKKPDSTLLSSEQQFVPQKIVVDDRGYMYVVCEGNENGLYMLDLQGNFRGFFGANRTEMGFADMLIRMFYSKQQRQGQVVKLPFSYVNVGSKDGYIYASTTGATLNQIRRLSPSGGDVLFGGKNKDFSDSTIMSGGRQNFVDFTVDQFGNLTVLDQTYGKIYQYDKEGKMLFAFGDIGVNTGCFLKPSSIAVDSAGRILVLDADRGCLQSFYPTDFTNNIHVANSLYSQGKYADAMGYWQTTLKINSQYDIAQQAMGRIYYRTEDYGQALYRAMISNDKEGYSLSFSKNREILVAKYFNLIVVFVILLLLLVSYVQIKKRKSRKSAYKINVSSKNIISRVFYVVFHPFDFFSELKYKDLARYSHMFILLGLYVFVKIASIVTTSFLYRTTLLEETNWVNEIGLCIAPWLLLCLANYGLTSLADGKGKFKEVMVGGAYCLSPLIIITIPIALLTNALSLDEKGFLNILVYIAYFLVLFLAFVFQQEVHNYTMSQSIIVLVLTLLGAVILASLIIIAFGLFGQLIDFVTQIAREVTILVS